MDFIDLIPSEKPIRACAAQRGRDFETSDADRGVYFQGVS